MNESQMLAQALQKLFIACVANHKAAAGSVIREVSLDVTEAVKDLGPILSQLGSLGTEAKADPITFAEAFVMAGFEVAKALKAPTA